MIVVRSTQVPGMNRSTWDATYRPPGASATVGVTELPCPIAGIHGTIVIASPVIGASVAGSVTSSSITFCPRAGAAPKPERTVTWYAPPSLVSSAMGADPSAEPAAGAADEHAASMSAAKNRPAPPTRAAPRSLTALRPRRASASLPRGTSMMMRPSFVASFALAALSVLSLGACSAHPADAPADSGPGTPAVTLCSADSRAQTFTPGMEQPGKNGAVKVRLLEATPSPPDKGSNAWTIEIVDAAGAPVDGLALTVKPFMPDHGHGASVTPQIAAMGAGKYSITLLDLFMPGVWTITFTVPSPSSADAGAPDSATFTFCIPG
jgi:hypothetical protein